MGPMTNALVLAATVIWWQPLESVFGSPAVALWCIVNALLVLFALVPKRVNDLGRLTQTDGLALLTISKKTSEELSIYLFAAPLMRALSRFEDGNYSGARKQVTAALAQAPESVLLRIMQAACSMSDGEYQAGLDAIAPLVSHATSEPANVRAAIYNNAAFGLVMSSIGVADDDPKLLEAERLSAESYRLYPCILEYRSTRALVLTATGRAEESLQLLDYPLFQAATTRQKAQAEVARAFALRQRNRFAEAEVAAATALRLEPSIICVVRSLGVTPDPTAPAVSLVPPAKPTHMPVTAEQEPLSGTAQALARLAGIILLVFGIALGALVGLGIERNFGSPLTISASASVGLTVLALLSAFCCTVGYRLALYRPNRYGSIVSPNLWLLLTVAFGSQGLVLGAMSFLSPRSAGGNIAATACSFAFAALCWKARDFRRS
jgi:tetratricopeptide (TPR) repeat protein